MPWLELDEEPIYEKCTDPDCPANRDGFEHAHFVRAEKRRQPEE